MASDYHRFSDYENKWCKLNTLAVGSRLVLFASEFLGRNIYNTIPTDYGLTFVGSIIYPNKSLSHPMYVSLALTLIWSG